jgi:hypothetical protein
MTYGRDQLPDHRQSLDDAVVSHSAELVRGDSNLRGKKAPSSAPTGHLLPKGRRDHKASLEDTPRDWRKRRTVR